MWLEQKSWKMYFNFWNAHQFLISVLKMEEKNDELFNSPVDYWIEWTIHNTLCSWLNKLLNILSFRFLEDVQKYHNLWFKLGFWCWELEWVFSTDIEFTSFSHLMSTSLPTVNKYMEGSHQINNDNFNVSDRFPIKWLSFGRHYTVSMKRIFRKNSFLKSALARQIHLWNIIAFTFWEIHTIIWEYSATNIKINMRVR